jgi:YVTN family beta-propeller protein
MTAPAAPAPPNTARGDEFGTATPAQSIPEAKPPSVPSAPVPEDDRAERERIYVINTGSDSVSVIHARQHEVIARIPLGAMPHGLATSGAGDRVYVATEDTGEVIAIDTADRLLFTPDRNAQRLSIVDVSIGQQVDELRVPLPTLHNAYVTADGTHVYQTSITGQAIVKINIDERAIVRQYAINGQPRPAQIMRDESSLFTQLTALNGFIQIDLESGDELARIAWPEPQQLPPGYDPQAKCHGLGLNRDDSEIWATSSMLSQVRVYSVPALEPLAEIDIGPIPNWMDFSHDGKEVYITSQVPAERNGQVAVIDTAQKKVVATIEVESRPKRIHALILPVPP